jgi:DNA topoisomerase-1
MALLIVESPSKAKTIAKYLGDGWTVRASFGHFRDLPPNPKDGIGVDPNTFAPQYETQNKQVEKTLRSAAKNDNAVFLATDPDREGEAIAWHVAKLLKLPLDAPQRVTFNEVTASAVQKAVQVPRPIDLHLVRAQEARRVLDRLIGYKVSPRLGAGQSAGRVQSVALRLIVDRDREIESYTPTFHYGVRATESANASFVADWDTSSVLGEDEPYLLDQALADRIATTTVLTVVATEAHKRRAHAPKPFWTSTMQQAASSQLELSSEDTMAAAQSLYEAGHITYHRTDSPAIAEEAQDAIRTYLVGGGHAVPEKPPKHKGGDDSQGAHECIRPTNISLKITGDTDPQKALYRLIRLRTLASQMISAVYDVTTATFVGDVPVEEGTPARFNAKGEECIELGWRAALSTDKDVEEDEEEEDARKPLPPMSEGTRVAVDCMRLDKSTKAPARYTEASLTRELERRGIGRPSTYASIIGGLRRRKYLSIKSRMLRATPPGIAVVDALVTSHFSFMEYAYTRTMESDLDLIAAGKSRYFDVVAAGNKTLHDELGLLAEAASLSDSGVKVTCPECQAPMRRITAGKKGAFWGCSHYPECKTTLPDKDGEPGVRVPQPKPDPSAPCPDCGRPMQQRTSGGEAFWGCSGYPTCKTTLPDENDRPKQRQAVSEMPTVDAKCNKCGAAMRVRSATKGKNAGGQFLGCSKYPKCKNTQPLPDAEPDTA